MRIVSLLVCALAALAGAPALAGTSESELLRGIVRPVRHAQISTDLQVPVVELSVKEGDSFRAGETLIRFDCERLEAEQDAAEASYQEMKLTYESQDYLLEKGAAGRLDVAIAKARADKALSEQRALGARIKQCTIIAPFDGRVTELGVQTFEVPASGKPVIAIVEESRFEIDIIAPSTYLRWVEPGKKLRFTVDETGSTYDAEIMRVGAIVDPVSQTVKLTAGMTPGDRRVVSGMSGTAVFAEQELSQ